MSRYPLLSKTLMVCLMALLLLIPLNMIESKISERQDLQHGVQQDIARSSAGPQTINGPYLVIQYRQRLTKTTKDANGNEKTTISVSPSLHKVIAPRSLKIDGNAGVDTRHRGIYQARLFNLESTMDGDFVVPPGYGTNVARADIIPEAAYFVLGISDSRGIVKAPKLTLNGESLEFSPGAVGPISGNGIHVQLPAPALDQSHAFHFSFPFNLQGMTTLAVTPVASNTEMTLQSTWPHPSFGGDYLPHVPSVNAKGFHAEWSVSNLARNMAEGEGSKPGAKPDAFSVSFIDPINVYLMSERAVKYGVLFVVLVFTSFFMFEIMRGLRIHPLQYMLVGLAMAMFFLLIISLSEHIPFVAAYLISGAACVALIGSYLSGMLKNRRLAAGFAGGIGMLYVVLYGVLQSEDNALLMGTLIIFIALAAVMQMTRHLDWYRFNQAAPEAVAA